MVRFQAGVSTATFKAITEQAQAAGLKVGPFLDSIFAPSAPKPKPKPKVPSLPHVWKVDKLNRNVCGNCGGQKIVINGQPCPGAPES